MSRPARRRDRDRWQHTVHVAARHATRWQHDQPADDDTTRHTSAITDPTHTDS